MRPRVESILIFRPPHALTSDGTTLRLYFDAQQVAEAPAFAAAPSNADLEIGRAGGILAWYYGGLIDEVRLYSVALSRSEIQNDAWFRQRISCVRDVAAPQPAAHSAQVRPRGVAGRGGALGRALAGAHPGRVCSARNRGRNGDSELAEVRSRGRGGTSLSGCNKLHVPLGKQGASEAPFGFVFQLAQDRDGIRVWNFIAFGERHPANPATRTV